MKKYFFILWLSLGIVIFYQNCAEESKNGFSVRNSMNQELEYNFDLGENNDSDTVTGVVADADNFQPDDSFECLQDHNAEIKNWNFTSAHVERFRVEAGSSVSYQLNLPFSEINSIISKNSIVPAFYFNNAGGGVVPVLSRCPHSDAPVCPGKYVYSFEGSKISDKNYSGLCLLKLKDTSGKNIPYYLNFISKDRGSGVQSKLMHVDEQNPRLCPKEFSNYRCSK